MTRTATAPVIAAGPPAWPLLGHLPAFLHDKLGFLSTCVAQYDDVVKLRIGEPTFLLNNPDDIKHVLVINHENYDKSPRLTSVRGKRLSGDGLLTSLGAAHLKQRRMLQPAFHRKTMASFAEVMTSSTAQMLANWKGGAELNIAHEMMELAQRIIVRSVFGADFSDDAGELAVAISTRRRYMEHVFFSPMPEWMPSRIGRAYRRAMGRIDETIDRAICERRQDAADFNDMLSLLIRAKYDDGTAMTDKQVHDEAMTLLITGYETIGEALAWTWYLLTQHQDVEAKLFVEVDEVLKGRLPRTEDIPTLRYTAMVLAESLRLYPPTWIFIRKARQVDTLPSGVRIPAGAKLYLCQYVMHRNPRYFPQPERFNPERFSESVKRQRPQFAYFPFGGGPRVCIGESFAKMEGVLVLACIAQRFRFTLVPDQEIVPEPKMTLRPKNGIWIRVESRSEGRGHGGDRDTSFLSDAAHFHPNR